MSKKSFLAAALLCASALGTAAANINLSVDSLLERVADHNAAVRAARSRNVADIQGIEVAKSARLPQISAQLDLSYLGDGTVLDRDFSNAMRDKLPHFGNTLNVSIYQPVYHGGIINSGIELARRQADLSSIGIDQQIEASGIEALRCYFSLMQMVNLRKVYAENIALTEKLIDNMKERHIQGVALKNDITRYELRLSSLRYDCQTVENRISVLNNNLASLLGYPEATLFTPQEMETIAAGNTLSEDEWQQLTMQQSSDLKAIDASREIARAGLKMEKGTRLPMVGLFAGDNLTGPVTFEIPALNKNYNAWYVGLSVKYNISSLFTTGKKERQKQLEINHIADNRASLEEALQRRVHECYTDMVQANQMLATERENVGLANENYDIVSTRFDNGMALLTDMLDASTAKLDSEIRLVNARISHLLAFYQLKYISGTLTSKS